MAVRRWNDAALSRLGALLQVRRIELDPRYHSRKLFGEETGINLRRIADLENGRRGGATPLALKELFAPAYKVTYESVLDVLNDRGGLEALPGSPPHKPPRGRPPAPPVLDRRGDPFPPMSRQLTADAEPHFGEVATAILRAADEHPGVPLEGRWVFPADEADAAAWDALATRGWTTWQLAQSLAVIRASDPARQPAQDDEAARA